MLGALIGDVIGSSYEGVDNLPTKDYYFPLFTEKSSITDDSLMTLAAAETLLYKASPTAADFEFAYLVWARRHPHVGWGKAFKAWFQSENPQPYYSFGNGSAMRVSPIGFAFGAQTATFWGEHNIKHFAAESAAPSHNHPEGIKGAQAIATAIGLARAGRSKVTIQEYIDATFGYNLSTPLDQIRPTYEFNVTCQGSVPQSIRAFLESTDFESAVRLAVSLGGDADTMGCMTGAIAHAFYRKIPKMMLVQTFERMPHSYVDLALRFCHRYDVPY